MAIKPRHWSWGPDPILKTHSLFSQMLTHIKSAGIRMPNPQPQGQSHPEM